MFKQLMSVVLSAILMAQGVMAGGVPAAGLMPADDSRQQLSEKLLEKPYLELLELTPVQSTAADFDRLRNRVKEQRKMEQERVEQEEKSLQEELEQLRDELKKINATGSRDTPEAAARRMSLHEQIRDLEKQIEAKKIEREKGVPVVFENKLAKIDLLEQWPKRQREIQAAIESGRAREREFGDVEDIGVRIIAAGQEEDIEVGQKAVREMEASGTLPPRLTEPQVVAYVTGLAARIARNSDLRVPIKVTVLDTEEINAFALPGGFLFVNRGLLDKAETESELAGVIAHEIAHAAARHGHRLMRKASLFDLLGQAAQIGVLIFSGGTASLAGYYLFQLGFASLGLFIDLNLLGVSREFESEADQLGVQYLWSAGYDPNGFITFFDKMTSEEGYVRSASFFRTHPPFFDRIVSTFSEIEFLPKKARVQVDSSGFQSMKQRVEDYEATKNGEEEYRPTLRRNSWRGNANGN